MRIMRYYIINKTTFVPIFTSTNRAAAESVLAAMADKDSYTISHKWLSI